MPKQSQRIPQKSSAGSQSQTRRSISDPPSKSGFHAAVGDSSFYPGQDDDDSDWSYRPQQESRSAIISLLQRTVPMSLTVFRDAIPPDKNVNIYDLYPNLGEREPLVSFHYPNYSSKEAGLYSEHPFWYTVNMNPLTRRAAESPTGILVSEGKGLALVHESTAKSERLKDYQRALLGHRLALATYSSDYRKRLRELTEGRVLISPTPFIPSVLRKEGSYPSDPQVIARMNNKDHLNEIVPDEFLPKRIPGIALDVFEVEKVMEEEGFSFPLMLKGGGGNSGGNMVRVASGKEDIFDAIRDFSSHHCVDLTMEEFFEHDSNTNVQMVVTDEEPQFFGASQQVLGEDATSYGGNIFDIRTARNPYLLPHQVWKASRDTAVCMKEAGYRGIVGLDVLHNRREDKARLIDPNARLNGSTPALAILPLMKELADARAREMVFLKKVVRASIDEVMLSIDKLLERGDAFVLGAASDHGESKILMAVFGDEEKREKVEREIDLIQA